MNIPDDLLYVKTHEWLRVDGDVATIGITDFAQEELGDVVYLELPAAGAQVAPEEPFGVVESIKAVSELFSGVAGTVVEANSDLLDAPERVNEDPYGEAWMIRLRLSEVNEPDSLLTAEDYRQLLEEA